MWLIAGDALAQSLSDDFSINIFEAADDIRYMKIHLCKAESFSAILRL